MPGEGYGNVSQSSLEFFSESESEHTTFLWFIKESCFFMNACAHWICSQCYIVMVWSLSKNSKLAILTAVHQIHYKVFFGYPESVLDQMAASNDTSA